MEIIINNNIVQSYEITRHKSGIVELQIRTKKKNVEYLLVSHLDFLFFADILRNFPDLKDDATEWLRIDELEDLKNYAQVSRQNKDEIAIYYIPEKLISEDE